MEHVGYDSFFSEVQQNIKDQFLKAVKESDLNLNLDQLVAEYDQEDVQYRSQLASNFEQKRLILSDSFWLKVYNNTNITRPQLETYLKIEEKNEFFKAFGNTHKDALDVLYARLNRITADEKSGIWYVFWHDVWIQNKDLYRVRSNRHLLDVAHSEAICYNVLTRGELEAKLIETGLKSVIKANMVDALYMRMSSSVHSSHEVKVNENVVNTTVKALSSNDVEVRMDSQSTDLESNIALVPLKTNEAVNVDVSQEVQIQQPAKRIIPFHADADALD